jgi:hypothetical protein
VNTATRPRRTFFTTPIGNDEIGKRGESQAQRSENLPTFWLTVEDHPLNYCTESKTATHDLYYADVVDVEVCRSAEKGRESRI